MAGLYRLLIYYKSVACCIILDAVVHIVCGLSLRHLDTEKPLIRQGLFSFIGSAFLPISPSTKCTGLPLCPECVWKF